MGVYRFGVMLTGFAIDWTRSGVQCNIDFISCALAFTQSTVFVAPVSSRGTVGFFNDVTKYVIDVTKGVIDETRFASVK